MGLTTADHGRIDPTVVAALYEQHANELRLFLIGVLRDADLAAEALQNTFTKAVASGHTAREESLKSWLFQVGFHEALLLRRKDRVHDKSLRALAEALRTKSDQSSNPSRGLAAAETVEQVRQAVEGLPPDQQQVVRMRIYEEKTFAVIAEELSTPLGTVLTRMRLALKRLSQALKPPE